MAAGAVAVAAANNLMFFFCAALRRRSYNFYRERHSSTAASVFCMKSVVNSKSTRTKLSATDIKASAAVPMSY